MKNSTVDSRVFILELGSQMIKCGLSGEDRPRNVFPTIVGRPKLVGIMVGLSGAKVLSPVINSDIMIEDAYIGDEAFAKRKILTTKYPIENGTVTNFNDFEKILHHTIYNEIRECPEERPILVIHDNVMDKKEKSKLIEIGIETFDFPGFALRCANELGILGLGKTSGIGVSLGHNISSAECYFEGQNVKPSQKMIKLGGADIDKDIISETQSKFDEYNETKNDNRVSYGIMEILVSDIKENYSEVRMPVSLFDLYRNLFHLFPVELIDIIHQFKYQQVEDLKYYINPNYWKFINPKRFTLEKERKLELPDDQYIVIDGNVLSNSPEVLFEKKPGGKSENVPSMIRSSIENCEKEVMSLMYENICLFGGTANLKNLVERFQKEFEDVPKADFFRGEIMKVGKKVYKPFSIFNGGSVCATLPQFQKEMVKKEFYEEHGPQLCVEKYFS